MTPLPTDIDFVLDGLRHRKWVFPARVYTTPGYGVMSERRVYSVGEAPYAVTFTVRTGIYPEGFTRDAPPKGMDQSAHRVEADGTYPCVYLDGSPCRNDGSGIDAEDWYDTQPKDAEGFVADDAVFAHLRELYVEWSKP